MVDLNGKKILITFLGRLSNLISITPFIRALKNASPAAKLVFLADEKYKDIVINNPCLDEVITIDKLLKFSGVADTGGQAFQIVLDGLVKINGVSVKENLPGLSSPGCSVIFEKTTVLPSILTGVPVFNLAVFIPASFN